MMRCSAIGMIIALKTKRDRGGDIEMRRVLHEGLPGDGKRQHDRLQREDVEQRIEPRLIEQHEAHQHERAGEQMGDVEGEPVHFNAP